MYGIVILRPGNDETPHHVNSLLLSFFNRYGEVDLSGHIVVITPKRIRFRPPLER